MNYPVTAVAFFAHSASENAADPQSLPPPTLAATAPFHQQPFKTNFYIEPPEVAAMTDEEVAAVREELDNIKIRVRPTRLPDGDVDSAADR